MNKRPYINTLINKLIYCACTFFANAFLTRALGVELKGTYTWILNTANIISIIAGLGIYQSIPFYSRSQMHKDIVQEYINIFVLQAIVYTGVSFAIVNFTGHNVTIICVCLLYIVDIFSQQLNMLLLVDKIYERNRVFVLGSIINLVICFFCFIKLKNNLYAAVGCFVIVKIFYIVFYLYIAKKIPHPTKVSVTDIVRKIHFGYIPMLSFLLITMNYKIDVLMLKANSSVSAAQLSFYTTGVSIAEIAWVIPDCFKEVLFSRTSSKKNDEEVASALRVSNFVIALTIVGIIIFGKLAIRIFLGSDFIQSYGITIVLFLGIPAMSWFKIIYTFFNAKGKRKTSFFVLMISTLSNIILNILLIPQMGIYGAAIASIFSYGVCGIIFLELYAKDVKLKFRTLFFPQIKDFQKLLRRDVKC